jgi:hypothetical protein
MSAYETSLVGLTVTIDGGADLANFMEALGRRVSRAELLPILKSHMGPVVEAERATLSSHSKSGALSASLKQRSGSGDRPDVISVFSAPTATRKQLKAKWAKGRAQQRRWAKGIEPGRGRRAVFYAPMLELGHRIVKRNAEGQLYDTGGRAAPVPFASTATGVLELQGELAAKAILNHIVGE